jgi:lipoprotein-anchoring transpeptidase ErfK/SrfK
MKRLLILVILTLFATAAPAEVVSGPLTMAVSTKKKILVVRIGATDVKRYSVAVGSKGHPTPNGRFVVRHIVWNPAWHPPDAKWAKGKTAKPPGHPDNPMKVVKIFFQEPDYYIHGTDDEDSLGEAASHGCIRMSESDVFQLARYLQEHAGAPKPDSWYEAVTEAGRPASVVLPRGVPTAIGQ